MVFKNLCVLVCWTKVASGLTYIIGLWLHDMVTVTFGREIPTGDSVAINYCLVLLWFPGLPPGGMMHYV